MTFLLSEAKSFTASQQAWARGSDSATHTPVGVSCPGLALSPTDSSDMPVGPHVPHHNTAAERDHSHPRHAAPLSGGLAEEAVQGWRWGGGRPRPRPSQGRGRGGGQRHAVSCSRYRRSHPVGATRLPSGKRKELLSVWVCS